MRIAINGFGRIGRSVFRIIEDRDDMEVVAINDLFDNDALRYLLAYDTVMGPFGKRLVLEEDHFVTDKGRVKLLNESSPEDLPWSELGIDAVVEATGVFRKRKQLEVVLERFEEQQEILQDQKREIEDSIHAMDVSINYVRARLNEVTD